MPAILFNNTCQNILCFSQVWPVKFYNITWAPVIYETATLILPEATVEVRQSFDWNEFSNTEPYACVASQLRESEVTIWGTLDGSKAHLLVGTGADN